jgi:hypothetical protein
MKRILFAVSLALSCGILLPSVALAQHHGGAPHMGGGGMPHFNGGGVQQHFQGGRGQVYQGGRGQVYQGGQVNQGRGQVYQGGRGQVYQGHAPVYQGNRGYENRGYENRGYEHRGYENRGYENRGYENRGYENRGYERGYGNRGYERGYEHGYGHGYAGYRGYERFRHGDRDFERFYWGPRYGFYGPYFRTGIIVNVGLWGAYGYPYPCVFGDYYDGAWVYGAPGEVWSIAVDFDGMYVTAYWDPYMGGYWYYSPVYGYIQVG